MGQETTGSRVEGMRGLAALKQATATLARKQQPTQQAFIPSEASATPPVSQTQENPVAVPQPQSSPKSPQTQGSLAHRGSTRKVPDPSELRLLADEQTDESANKPVYADAEPIKRQTHADYTPNKTAAVSTTVQRTSPRPQQQAINAPKPESRPEAWEDSPLNRFLKDKLKPGYDHGQSVISVTESTNPGTGLGTLEANPGPVTPPLDNKPEQNTTQSEPSLANRQAMPSDDPHETQRTETAPQNLHERSARTAPTSTLETQSSDRTTAGTPNWVKAVANQNLRTNHLSQRQESGSQSATQFSQHRKQPKMLRDVPFTTSTVPDNHLAPTAVAKPDSRNAEKSPLPREIRAPHAVEIPVQKTVGSTVAPATRKTSVPQSSVQETGKSPFLKTTAGPQSVVTADKSAASAMGGRPPVTSKPKSMPPPLSRPNTNGSTAQTAIPKAPAKARDATVADREPTQQQHTDSDIHRRQAMGNVGAMLDKMPDHSPTADENVAPKGGKSPPVPSVKIPNDLPPPGKPSAQGSQSQSTPSGQKPASATPSVAKNGTTSVAAPKKEPARQENVTQAAAIQKSSPSALSVSGTSPLKLAAQTPADLKMKPSSGTHPTPTHTEKSPSGPRPTAKQGSVVPGPRPAPHRIVIQGKDPVEIGAIVKKAAMNARAAFTPATTQQSNASPAKSIQIAGKSLPKPPPQGNPQKAASSPASTREVSPQEKKKVLVGNTRPQPVVITSRTEPVKPPSTAAKPSARLVVTLPPKDERVACDSGKKLSIQTPSGQIHLSTRRRDDTAPVAHLRPVQQTSCASDSQSGESRKTLDAVCSSGFPGDGTEQWRVPVEGLGSGIIHLLGDAVGSVVSLGFSGGKNRVSGPALKTAQPGRKLARGGMESSKVSDLEIVTRKFTGGVRGIFSGVGQIAGGSMDIVLGTLGTLGGVIVQTSGKIGLGSKR